MFPIEVETLARLLVDEARQKSLRIVTAESCTGGLVAGAICAVAGASDVFERGFVTYSNRAKQELLGVPGDLIADLGAVSETDDGRILPVATGADHNIGLAALQAPRRAFRAGFRPRPPPGPTGLPLARCSPYPRSSSP